MNQTHKLRQSLIDMVELIEQQDPPMFDKQLGKVVDTRTFALAKERTNESEASEL